MSLLNNTDYKGISVDKRVVAPSIKRCCIGDIREVLRDAERTDGPVSKTFINLHLEEPAKSPDGEDLNPGFPAVVTVNEWEDPEEAKKGKAKMKELALAALGLPRKPAQGETGDEWLTALSNIGGWTALKGKHVLVDFTVSKNGFQDARSFNRIPNGAPGAA